MDCMLAPQALLPTLQWDMKEGIGVKLSPGHASQVSDVTQAPDALTAGLLSHFSPGQCCVGMQL